MSDKKSKMGVLSEKIYKNITKTKNRLPLFLIGLHIYICNFTFQTEDVPNYWIILYLVLMCTLTFGWELIIVLITTKHVDAPIEIEIMFAICYTLFRLINLVTICLFVTSGIPLSYLITFSNTIIDVATSVIFVTNYIFDYIEKGLSGDKYWTLLLNEREKIEENLLDHINKITFKRIDPSININPKIDSSKIKNIVQNIQNNQNNRSILDESTDELKKLFRPSAKIIVKSINNGDEVDIDNLTSKLVSETIQFIEDKSMVGIGELQIIHLC